MTEQKLKREATATEAMMGERVRFLIDLHFNGRPTRLARFLGVPYVTVWRWTVYGCKARTRNVDRLEKLKELGYNPNHLVELSDLLIQAR